MTCQLCGRTMMAEICDCGWRDNTALTPELGPPIRSTHREIPLGISKEECGVALVETIKCVGGILQLREARAKTNLHFIRPGQLTDWGKREQVLVKALAAHMPTLSAEDAGAVVRQYPWVARC